MNKICDSSGDSIENFSNLLQIRNTLSIASSLNLISLIFLRKSLRQIYVFLKNYIKNKYNFSNWLTSVKVCATSRTCVQAYEAAVATVGISMYISSVCSESKKVWWLAVLGCSINRKKYKTAVFSKIVNRCFIFLSIFIMNIS